MFKKNTNQLLMVIFLTLALSACSTTGSLALKEESPIMVISKFRTGTATKEQILNTMGAPNNITLTENGLEIMSYEYTRTTPRLRNFTPLVLFSAAFDKEVKQVKFLLNPDNTLKSVAINETILRESYGLAE